MFPDVANEDFLTKCLQPVGVARNSLINVKMAKQCMYTHPDGVVFGRIKWDSDNM